MILIECDCSVAEKCPQGKTGPEPRCKIWKRLNRLKATAEIATRAEIDARAAENNPKK